jgi:GDPmannose 4,6-dehydratase
VFSQAGLDWKDFVKLNSRYERPTEVEALIGDPTKARVELGWEPKTYWKDLAKIMLEADLEA